MIGIGVGIPHSKGIQRLKYLLDEDFAQGATAAYALRLLREKHSGGIIRCRADDQGTSKGEADVLPILQPDGSKIITLNSPIENFSGTPFSGDGYVLADLIDAGNGNYDGLTSSWYDQSPNLNDASNSTASEQPQIVSSGSVIQENGNPAIDFNLKSLVSNYPLNENAHSYMYFTLQSFKNKKNKGVILQGGRSFVIERGSTVNGNIGGANLSMPFNLNNQFIFTGEWNLLNNNYRIFKNDVQKKSITTPPDRTTFQTEIGASNGGVNCIAFIQEILIFEGNDFSGRPKINQNINNFYSIF